MAEEGDPPVKETKKKEHLNIVLIGHVDAGKSTTGGQILISTGVIDKRTAEKCRQEAKEKNHEGWWLSYVLDLNPDERDKGKTIETGRGTFQTPNKNFTLLDAPGHKGFVPEMISGASQADVAVLVISARKGEFETGFERGGQTREHAMLAKTAGVRQLVVLINKMDDPTVKWDEDRFKECRDKLMPFLKKSCGFKDKEIAFIPASSFTGAYIKDRAENECPWYKGPSLLEHLDSLPELNIVDENSVFIMPITGKHKDMGTIVTGKIESGIVTVGAKLVIMPNKIQVEAVGLYTEEKEVTSLQCGDNGRIKLKNVEEEEVAPGMVLCDAERPCKSARIFDAQLYILETKSIICAGYTAVLHVHAATEEVKLSKIHYVIDKRTQEKNTRARFAKTDQLVTVRLEVLGKSICIDKFTEFDGRLSRFTLRDEGKTVALGKVLQVVE
jgi:peptide chain release factor subunit 3